MLNVGIKAMIHISMHSVLERSREPSERVL